MGLFWLPESPEFYFAKGRFDESKAVLLKIAAINGRDIDESQICFDKDVIEEATKDVVRSFISGKNN